MYYHIRLFDLIVSTWYYFGRHHGSFTCFLLLERLCLKNTILYKKSSRQIKDINFSAFNDRVKSTHWLLINEPDVNIEYENFHNKLFNIYHESFLVQVKLYKIYKNKYKPRHTVGIYSVEEKNKLYKNLCKQNPWKPNLNILILKIN